MTNSEQLERLAQGVEAWNEWRRDNPAVQINLIGTNLSGANLSMANLMDAIKILQATQTASWDYDEAADVLYLSIGKPQPAIGVDIGDGIVLRYDETTKEVVGLTMIGLRAKLPKHIS